MLRSARSGSCVFAHPLTRNEPSTVRSIACVHLDRVTINVAPVRQHCFDQYFWSSYVKGLAKTLFDAAMPRKKAVCVWANEFHKSKLDVYSHQVHRPRERCAGYMRTPVCWTERHAMDAPSCRYFSVHHSWCAVKRTVGRWCAEYAKPQFQYDVC